MAIEATSLVVSKWSKRLVRTAHFSLHDCKEIADLIRQDTRVADFVGGLIERLEVDKIDLENFLARYP